MAKKTVTAWVGLCEGKVMFAGITRNEVLREMDACLIGEYVLAERKGFARIVKAKITWDDK